jgi:integrase
MPRKRRGRGEGSIYQEADGRWAACVSFGYDGKGRRRRRKVRGKTKADVQARLGELARQGPDLGVEGLFVGKYLTDWLQDQCDRGEIGETSRPRYETAIRLHLDPYWGRTLLTKTRHPHVEMWLRQMRERSVTPTTQRFALRILNAALNAAVRKEILPSNPCSRVDKPKRKDREIHLLDEAQAQRLLDAARGHELYPLYVLALASGLRIGELLALAWPDVDLERGTVRVRHTLGRVDKKLVVRQPKTPAARRTITIPPEAVAALREHRGRQERAGHLGKVVFCSSTGGYKWRDYPGGRLLWRLLAKAGLPRIRFHDLRHTHASILLSRGGSLRAVASRLGHSKPEMTLRVYAHVMPNDDAALAALIGGALGGQNGSRMAPRGGHPKRKCV